MARPRPRSFPRTRSPFPPRAAVKIFLFIFGFQHFGLGWAFVCVFFCFVFFFLFLKTLSCWHLWIYRFHRIWKMRTPSPASGLPLAWVSAAPRLHLPLLGAVPRAAQAGEGFFQSLSLPASYCLVSIAMCLD